MKQGKRRPARLLVLALLAIGIAPGTWVRTHFPPPDFSASLKLTELDAPQGLTSIEAAAVTLSGAWQLDSRNEHFGGYSALITLPDDRLLAGSDRGRLLEMPLPQSVGADDAAMSFFAGVTGGPKTFTDLEALERNESGATIWGAYEHKGRIERIARNAPNSDIRGVNISAMMDWPQNGGAETMVRLSDGRFVVIAESSSSKSRPALIFAGDPLARTEPVAFRFMPPDGYSPVDATLLPDGRVMILVRRVTWGLPPRFATGLVLADPAAIKKGVIWRGELIASLTGPDLDENFEGIASIETQDGTDLYLIADDNLSAFQDTLMLRLNWKAEPMTKTPDSKKAQPDDPAAPL